MSTTRISSVPHATSRSIWVIADITIGPRQIIAVSSSTRKPIDMIASPKRRDRDHLLVVVELRLLANAGQPRYRRPINVGVEQADAQTEIAQARAPD